jgi:hypothetical protein
MRSHNRISSRPTKATADSNPEARSHGVTGEGVEGTPAKSVTTVVPGWRLRSCPQLETPSSR